jgi:hypothetical protein
MKNIIIIVALLLMSVPVGAADSPESVFTRFMEEVIAGHLKRAIGDYGIDERKDKSFLNLKVPGDLTYQIKDVNVKKNGTDATVKTNIEYTSVTEKAGDTVGKAKTVGKAATGNVAGAAANVGKNKAGDLGGKYTAKETVKMRKVDGEWKVVVTDKLYDQLTGK